MSDHPYQGAAASRSRTFAADTAHGSRARSLGVAPRLNGTATGTVRANPTLRDLRERAVAVLLRSIGHVKPEALAAGCNATRTLVVRWLDTRFVDRRPAPLAWLLALDDGDFEAVVAELRKERAR